MRDVSDIFEDYLVIPDDLNVKALFRVAFEGILSGSISGTDDLKAVIVKHTSSPSDDMLQPLIESCSMALGFSTPEDLHAHFRIVSKNSVIDQSRLLPEDCVDMYDPAPVDLDPLWVDSLMSIKIDD